MGNMDFYVLERGSIANEADGTFDFLGIFSTLEKAKEHAAKIALPYFMDENDNPIGVIWEEIYYDGPHWLSNQSSSGDYFTIELEQVDNPTRR